MRTAGKRLGRRVVGLVPMDSRQRVKRLLPRRVIRWYRTARSDVFLVSFPKSGRTWLRLMIGRALQDHYGIDDELGLIELHRLSELQSEVPSIVATHDDAMLRPADELAASTERYRGAAVILMVRDPRDVLVSLYHHLHGREHMFDGTLSEFVSEPDGALASMLAFSDAWAARLVDPVAPTHLVRYEDLHGDPESELRKVLDFVGVEVADRVIADAVAFASFDNMRLLEESDALGTDKLRPGRAGDYNTYKTRKGKVGTYRDELSPGEIADLDRRIAASRLSVFGYS